MGTEKESRKRNGAAAAWLRRRNRVGRGKGGKSSGKVMSAAWRRNGASREEERPPIKQNERGGSLEEDQSEWGLTGKYKWEQKNGGRHKEGKAEGGLRGKGHVCCIHRGPPHPPAKASPVQNTYNFQSKLFFILKPWLIHSAPSLKRCSLQDSNGKEQGSVMEYTI